jgi:hypothetical protein
MQGSDKQKEDAEAELQRLEEQNKALERDKERMEERQRQLDEVRAPQPLPAFVSVDQEPSFPMKDRTDGDHAGGQIKRFHLVSMTAHANRGVE